MRILIPLALTILLAILSCSSPTESSTQDPGFPDLSGPYLGQPAPGSTPELFAPGIVSTGIYTRDVAISPDGKEIYFCVSLGNYTFSTILYTVEVDGTWTRPRIASFSGGPGTMDFEPAFSQDGSRLFFLSNRPDGDEAPGDQDIWYVERESFGWGDPVNVGPGVNTDGGEFFPSLTIDGTLYFSRNAKGSQLNQVYRSRWENGAFGEAELLPEQVNCGVNRFNAFVSPDESFMIVPAAGIEGSFNGVDYIITFRSEGDRWSEPQNMGALVNQGNGRGWSPYVSPDGNYFFFMASRTGEIEPEDWNYSKLLDLHNSPGNGNSSIYWMDASFIESLRDKATYN